MNFAVCIYVGYYFREMYLSEICVRIYITLLWYKVEEIPGVSYVPDHMSPLSGLFVSLVTSYIVFIYFTINCNQNRHLPARFHQSNWTLLLHPGICTNIHCKVWSICKAWL
jgi:hypothetical protein